MAAWNVGGLATVAVTGGDDGGGDGVVVGVVRGHLGFEFDVCCGVFACLDLGSLMLPFMRIYFYIIKIFILLKIFNFTLILFFLENMVYFIFFVYMYIISLLLC